MGERQPMIENKDNALLDYAKETAERSRDPSTQTGCVLTDRYGRILSRACNDIPNALPEWWRDRETKYKLVIHAEVGAALQVNKRLTIGGTAYIYPWMPCARCLAVLVELGIRRVVFPKMNTESARYKRWKDDFDLVRQYARRVRVRLVEVDLGDTLNN